jgi:26S proteasome regulatory subunit N2
MPGIVGAAVFVQYWYWFPLSHFLSLSFAPTAVIGVDQKLEAPKFKFHSNTRPSLFDYPPEQQVKTEEAPEKVKTAVLSTTAQAKRRAQRREKQARRESMDIDQTPTTPKVSDQLPEKMDVEEGAAGEGEETKDAEKIAAEGQKKKVEREKVGYELDNLSRVLPAQLKYLTFPDPRYEPVKRVCFHDSTTVKANANFFLQPTGGVVVVLDNQPDEPRETIELEASRKKPQAPAPSGETLQDRLQAAIGAAALQTPQRAAARAALSDYTSLGGAAAAAGVLTAVDEDEEGVEDAPVPDEFTYETDAEEE